MSEISKKTRRLFTLSLLKGVGPAALRKISKVADFEEADSHYLLDALPRKAGANITEDDLKKAHIEADRQIDLTYSSGARIISSADADYSGLLAKTKDDPQILFAKGSLSEAGDKSVAIIGTREPTEHGRVIAERLTRFFVEQGWSVVSGLALGCDAIAHQTALEAGGHTIAVLAHGLHTVAPKRNQKIADQILEAGGALVTEYHFGQDPRPTQFVKRDRIQAGLARGVVMIQSDRNGGSLHASRAAIDYGRWLAVPYPTEQDLMRREPKIQANLLIAEGSTEEKMDLLRCDVRDIARIIVLRGKSDYGAMLQAPNAFMDGDENQLMQAQLFDEVPHSDSAAKIDEFTRFLLAIEDDLTSHERRLGSHFSNREQSGLYLALREALVKAREAAKALREKG